MARSSAMRNDGPRNGGTMTRARSVSCPRKRRTTMIPYYRRRAPMQTSRRMTNTSVSRYRFLHPAKSNSIVLLPCISLFFFLYFVSCPFLYFILRTYVHKNTRTCAYVSFFPLFLKFPFLPFLVDLSTYIFIYLFNS